MRNVICSDVWQRFINIAVCSQVCLMLPQEGIAGLIPFADMVDYLEIVQE